MTAVRDNLMLLDADVAVEELMEFKKYGGPEYAHILRTIVPYMRMLGFSEEQINTLILKNPQKLLSLPN